MKKNATYVVGHKNPDTDSICSALAYANFKRSLGIETEAVRLGKISKETQFALSYFGQHAPKYISDVKARVEDMEFYPIKQVKSTDSLKKAWDSLNSEENNKLVAVTDEKGKFVGTVTFSDILKVFIETNSSDMFEKNNTSLKNLVNVLKGEIANKNVDKVVKGKIKIASSLEQVCGANLTQDDILITDAVDYMLEYAIKKSGAGIIILDSSSDEEYSKGRINEADANGAIIIKTPFNTFEIIKLLGQSVPVAAAAIQSNDLPIFHTTDYVEEIKETMLNSRHRSFPVLNSDNTIAGSITSKQLLNYRKRNLILVDHSEKSQAVDGIDDAELVEIIDHHRLGDVQTSKPIFMRSQPLGCTSTIIAMMYMENKVDITPQYAGLMLSAILSDTLLFKSPTCTDMDKTIAKKLAKKANVDIEAYGISMLKAGASLEGRSTRDVLTTDMKDFNMGEYLVTVAQVNTMDYEEFINRKEEFLKEMEEIRKEKEGDVFAFMVTDLLKEGSLLLYKGTALDIVGKAFNIDTAKDNCFLEGVVSRKKQMVPRLMAAV